MSTHRIDKLFLTAILFLPACGGPTTGNPVDGLGRWESVPRYLQGDNDDRWLFKINDSAEIIVHGCRSQYGDHLIEYGVAVFVPGISPSSELSIMANRTHFVMIPDSGSLGIQLGKFDSLSEAKAAGEKRLIHELNSGSR